MLRTLDRCLRPELVAFCGDDPRLLLLPGEYLHSGGVTPALAEVLRQRHAWTAERIDFLERAFAAYWARMTWLAARAPDWSPPRRRNLALVHDAADVLPYVQLLNTSCWTLYDCDFDPQRSHVEFAAYLLVHGDRMARTGEVTQAAVRNAAYWFERSVGEIDAFRTAAAASTRPDAEAFRALAASLNDLRQFADVQLRPPHVVAHYRPIPGSGLLVAPAQHAVAPALVQRWTEVAQTVVRRQQIRWAKQEPKANRELCEWLTTEVPPVLICARRRIVWDPQAPERLGPLRDELRPAVAVAVADIRSDLETAAAKTRQFRAAVVDANALPKPDPHLTQSGYVYLHQQRYELAYDLHEPGIERLHLPALPYARAMLGARALHEWSHLADAAGWIRRTVDASDWNTRRARSVQAFVTAIERVRTIGPRLAVASHEAPVTLVDGIIERLGDYRANLLLAQLASPTEREAYVRQNVRSLRTEAGARGFWTTLARYLYELQYLRFSATDDGLEAFFAATDFVADYLDSGLLEPPTFDELQASVTALCDPWEIDTGHLAIRRH